MSGLYVASNVYSLVSQNQLQRNIAGLSDILTRLSTGLRINSGKDDPAGLIASELMKADMTATTKAITNTQRANSMVGIADAALGQVSNLLNDIRGLVNEASSTATMTYEQIQANQLQVDAALDSIDRIAKTTNYQGKLLLDGSMDFDTKGLSRAAVKDLNVFQANFGTKTQVDVGINILQNAEHAQLFYDKAGVSQDTVIEVVGNDGANLIKIAGGSTVSEIADAINLVSDSTGVRAVVGKDATAGQIMLTSAGLDNDINLTALMTGAAAGNYTIKFTAGDTDKTTYTITEPQNGKPGIIDFKLRMQPNIAPSADSFDESYNNIYTYDISGPDLMNALPFDIAVQTSNGIQIKYIEYVASAAPNSSLPGGIAATFNKANGKLQIQYDASGNLTEESLKRAINAIDGFEYKGIYQNGTKASSINIDQINTTGYFINHTDSAIDGIKMTFKGSSTADRTVTVGFDGTAQEITVTAGSLATYDDIINALNATGAWSLTNGATAPAANSFKLTNASGEQITGSAVIDSSSTFTTTGTSITALSNVATTTTSVAAKTPVVTGSTPPAVDLYLQTLDTAWNGKTLEITAAAASGTAPTVTFNGTGIVVAGAVNSTYADILAALKNTSSWTLTGTATVHDIPTATGLEWVDAAGNKITDTSVNGTGQTITAFNGGSAGTGMGIELVVASPATTALQNFLSAYGTGTKAAIDMRANNALNISATVPGTKFENTDIVYVKAEGNTFSETFRVGYQNVYLVSENAGKTSPPDGWTIQFVSGPVSSTSQNAYISAADNNKKILTVTVADGASLSEVVAAINTDDPTHTAAAQIWKGTTSNYGFKLIDPTQAPIDTAAAGSGKQMVGQTLGLANVQLGYNDTPAAAAATITLDSGAVKMRIVANSVGTAYNDVAIEFEQDDSFKPGDVSVVYDAERKILHIRGQIDGADAATYGTLKTAIEKASPFHVDITSTNDNKQYPLSNKLHSGLSSAGIGTSGLTENAPKNSAVIKTGQYAADAGGDHQTLFITVAPDATANDVINAFRNAKGTSAQIAANFTVVSALDNDGTGSIFSSILDKDLNVRVFSGALTGGNNGTQTNVTAKELVDLINNDEVLSKIFRADVARGQVGNGFLTLFDEAAYYGSTVDDNALQFLGPQGSPDVLFVTDGANSPLWMEFVDSYGNACVTDDRPIASLNAQNANAAFTVQANKGGTLYDDMVVRMIRLDNNHSAADSYAQYKEGESNAMAYCSINNDQTLDGTSREKGKFILTANKNGDEYNNADIVVKLDVNQTESAKAYYDASLKKLVVTVNSGGTTLSDAVAAINKEGTFQAEYDYSFNTDPTDGKNSDGSGLETFAKLLSAMGTTEAVIGNTGTTGGHKGGVLEVYVGGTDTEISANAVISTINSSPTVKSIFTAKAIGGVDAGTGMINFRADNIRQVLGADGKTHNEVNMITDILGSDNNAQGYMVVHLATDANGNSITKAADLVKFFDTLTPEQTRGISVSVIRPAGVDNLDRIWKYDNCGNLIEEQLCEALYGQGLLQPTLEVDDCDNVTLYPIEFYSYGENIVPGSAYGSVVAQNGINASLNIQAKQQGPDFNGVGFKYVKLDDPGAVPYAEYDTKNKMLVVYVHESTTAGQVKSAIESSASTKDLFSVSLPGTGAGVISLQDDYMILKNGLYDAGYRGGAALLGAADADAHRLVIESLTEGSRAKASVHWIDGGEFVTKDVNGFTTDTDYGSDMVATINGMRAVADGRTLSLDTSMLKLQVILDERVQGADRIEFSITGGGAIIQMGPDVVSNQQIRLGIKSVSTGSLGGASGKMYQLRSGGEADLLTSEASRRLADRIVQEAIMSIAQTRGRLGSIQRNTLEPNIAALQDSLVAISEAEAQISNADFAEESSKLTRAQILVQAGTQTLSIANQFPQYAASLLGR